MAVGNRAAVNLLSFFVVSDFVVRLKGKVLLVFEVVVG